jgi:hypothetical protein
MIPNEFAREFPGELSLANAADWDFGDSPSKLSAIYSTNSFRRQAEFCRQDDRTPTFR